MASARFANFNHYEDQLLHRQNRRWQLLSMLVSASQMLSLTALIVLLLVASLALVRIVRASLREVSP